MREPFKHISLATLLLAAVAFTPAETLADEPISPCADALEQLTTLMTELPVYKLVGGSRKFLDDADRSTEIARIQRLVNACAPTPEAKAKLQAEAERLHRGRSPECEFEREQLSLMEKPDSRTSKDTIADQRKRVADRCPAVPLKDVWLLKIVGPRNQIPQ